MCFHPVVGASSRPAGLTAPASPQSKGRPPSSSAAWPARTPAPAGPQNTPQETPKIPQNTPQKGIRELQRQYVRNVILRHKDDEGADWIKYEFTNRNSESELSDCNFDNRWRGSGGQLLTSFGNGIVKPIYIRDVIGTHSKQFLINKYIRNATAFNEKYRCGSKLKSPPHFKKGGRIPKAGIYKLHKGEVVVPSHRVKTVDNALKKSGRSPLKKECKTCILSKKQLSDRKNIKDKLRFYSNTII